MANTFKFGNKNWAWKEGSVLAYNDENNNFKPLPFDFTRSSSATRVNKDGLIEVVGSDEPRVDYLNNADGHLLLEPQRTNYITNSKSSFASSWTIYRATVTDNATTSPEGLLNGTILAPSGVDTLTGGMYRTTHSWVGNTDYSYSVIAKKISGTSTSLRLGYVDNSSGYQGGSIDFDIVNGSYNIVKNDNGSVTAEIIDYGNGWYRCVAKFTTVAVPSYNYISIDNLSLLTSDEMCIYGLQLEQGSYATSYIPTSGSSVTRAVDEILNSSIPSGIYGSSKGSVYIDGIVGTPDSTGQMPFTGGVGTSELIYAWIKVDGKLTVEFYQGGAVQASISTATGFFNVGDSYKIAVAYQNNDFVVYANGSLIGADSSGTAPNPTTIRFGSYTSGNYKSGIIKNGRIYNTRLTNAELATLTSI